MAFLDLIATVDRHARALLGEAVTYAPGSGAPVAVQGIFDAEYIRVDVSEAGVSTCSPAVFLRLSELPSDPGEDDPDITIRGVSYRVRECKKDGQGGAHLFLYEPQT